MPRRKIEYSPGAIYHIFNRGAGRQSIFYEDENYRYLLTLVEDALAELEVSLSSGESILREGLSGNR